MATVKILNEVSSGEEGTWRLCFQWAQYKYDDGNSDNGYRFIWRRPDNSLQPARGQARIPNAKSIFDLISEASKEGWFVSVEK